MQQDQIPREEHKRREKSYRIPGPRNIPLHSTDMTGDGIMPSIGARWCVAMVVPSTGGEQVGTCRPAIPPPPVQSGGLSQSPADQA